jgi:hypothetical protein
VVFAWLSKQIGDSQRSQCIQAGWLGCANQWMRLNTRDSITADATHCDAWLRLPQCDIALITPVRPQIGGDAMIDKRLYSINMPLVYTRVSEHSYGRHLGCGPLRVTSSRRLRGRPEERRVRKIVQRNGYFSWDLIVIIRSPRPCTPGATTQHRV